MKEYMTLANKLKKMREEKQLTQEDVSQKLHISRQAISRWETGKGCPDIENLVSLAQLYNTSIDELLGNDISFTSSVFQKSKISKEKLSQNEIVEFLILVIVSILSCYIPLIGIVIPLAMMFWITYTKKKYKSIYIICIICLIIDIYNSFVILNHIFLQFGTSHIEAI